LRHNRVYPGKKGWTVAYLRWLKTVRLDHLALQVVFQNDVDAVSDTQVPVAKPTGKITELLPDYVPTPLVDAVQALRDVACVVAASVVAEAGTYKIFG
jgi:hypothetical protein